jgi:oxygen-independent coproporphyrinogen-3 oxidase
VGDSYAQNAKTLDLYYTRLDAGRLPIVRGIELQRDDVIRRDAIQRLMCDFALDFREIEAIHAIDFKAYFAHELAALERLAGDGLVTLSGQSIAVTPRGRLLVRTVAMHFDRRLREAQVMKRYSRVI